MKDIWNFLADPIKGKTSLWRVVWLYSLVGGVVVTVLEAAVFPGGEASVKLLAVLDLIYSTYVTIATYRCAGNGTSPAVARIARICAVISLILMPFATYLMLTESLTVAL